LIDIESKDDSASEHECPHVKKVIPYVQMFSIIIRIFSLPFINETDFNGEKTKKEKRGQHFSEMKD
jgi:hypothetical protein